MTAEQFDKLSEQNTKVLVRLEAIDTKLKPLFDNGQPGMLTQLDQRVDVLEKHHDQQYGFKAAIVMFGGIVLDGLAHFWGSRH